MSSLKFDEPMPRLPDFSVRPDLNILARPNQATADYTKSLGAESSANSQASSTNTRNYALGRTQAGDAALARAVLEQLGPSAPVAPTVPPASTDTAAASDAPPAMAPSGAPPAVTTSALPDTPGADDIDNPILGSVVTHATNKGLSPNLVAAMIDTESSWNPNAVSPKGATGLMQVMPATARDYGVHPDDLTDTDTNIDAGTSHFARLRTRYGDSTNALIAYNMGEGATDKWLASGGDPNKLPVETQDYVRKVIAKSSALDQVQSVSNLQALQPTSASAQAPSGSQAGAQPIVPSAAAQPSPLTQAAPNSDAQPAPLSQATPMDAGAASKAVIDTIRPQSAAAAPAQAPPTPSIGQPYADRANALRAQAAALARAGNGTQAAALLSQATEAQQKGADAVRTAELAAIEMYAKDPATGEAMAARVGGGFEIPAVMKGPYGGVFAKAIADLKPFDLKDPNQFGTALGLHIQYPQMPIDQIMQRIGAAKPAPTAPNYVATTTYNPDGSTNVTPMDTKNGTFMPGQAGLGRANPRAPTATTTRAQQFDQMFPSGTADPMDRLNYIQGRPIDSRSMAQKITQSVTTATDPATGKLLYSPDQQQAEIQRRLQLFTSTKPSTAAPAAPVAPAAPGVLPPPAPGAQPMPALPDIQSGKAALQDGVVYQTSRGPAKWDAKQRAFTAVPAGRADGGMVGQQQFGSSYGAHGAPAISPQRGSSYPVADG